MAITLKKKKKSQGRILYTVYLSRKPLKSFINRKKAISLHNSLKSEGAKLEAFDTDTQKKKYINK